MNTIFTKAAKKMLSILHVLVGASVPDHGEWIWKEWNPLVKQTLFYHSSDPTYLDKLVSNSLTCVQFISPSDRAMKTTSGGTERYPHNPSGTPRGITGLVSPNGRHLALMPHPERGVKWWQWPWVGEKVDMTADAPWMKMFLNAYDWCIRSDK